eukprot:TRINITY_DN74324_c0_g1_i1.p1 TRINITY_DN74324_c0_g1~~TRINITY_DN74324_c0_g1_i1.p1  ORF type:complete len:1144 (-),score=137.88 TRINITY_DN74324_c0_g1_i1:220-3618(-)
MTEVVPFRPEAAERVTADTEQAVSLDAEVGDGSATTRARKQEPPRKSLSTLSTLTEAEVRAVVALQPALTEDGLVKEVEEKDVIDQLEEEDAAVRARATEEHSGALRSALHKAAFLPKRASLVTTSVLNPPLIVELTLKILLAACLYIAAIVFAGIELSTTLSDEVILSKTLSATGQRQLKIEATACIVSVSSVSGSEVRITDTSLIPFAVTFNVDSHVNAGDNGNCLVLSCSGPHSTLGYLTTAHIEIGESSDISQTTVEFKTTSRSSVFLKPSAYGDKMKILAQSGIVQLESLSLQHLEISMDSGLVDLRHMNVPNATLSLGAAALSVKLPEEVGTRVELNGISAAHVGQGLCLSDTTHIPSDKGCNATGYGFSTCFEFGGPNISAKLTLIRTATTFGQTFITRGVSQLVRSEANTFDTTGNSGFAAEAYFATWATQMRNSGMQILRVRTVAPGFDDAQGAVTVRGEWLYSQHGDVYMWHPLPLFWLATFSLWSPKVAREHIIMSTARCRANSIVAQAAETCSLTGTIEGRNLTPDTGAEHAALWNALPTSMRTRNESGAELYHVRNGEPSTQARMSLLRNLAEGVVSKFKVEVADSLVSLVSEGDPGKFMQPRDEVFVAMGTIVIVLAPILFCILAIRFYQHERDVIILSEGGRLWPFLWKAEVEKHELIRSASSPAHGAVQAGMSSADLKAGDQALAFDTGSKIAVGSAPAARSPEAGSGGDSLSVPPPGTVEEVGACEVIQGTVRATVEQISQEVQELTRIETTRAREQIEKRAHRLISKLTHLFTVIDMAILARLPSESKKDGLLAALALAFSHFFIVLCFVFPLFAISWIQSHSTVFKQAGCALIDMVSGSCGPTDRGLPAFLNLTVVLSLSFMLCYSVVEYLSRKIDFLTFGDQPVYTSISVHRRRLLRIRASPIFRGVFWVLVVILLLGTSTSAVGFILYTAIAACVAPDYMIPVLLAIVALVFVAGTTYANLIEMRNALKQRLEKFGDDGNRLLLREEEIEDVLREMGFTSAQILLITFLWCVVFVAVVTFILLGCMLFMDSSSLIPTIVSSGMMIISGFAAVKNGKLDANKTSSFKLTASLNKHLARTQKIGDLAKDLVSTEDSKTALKDFGELDREVKPL